jgi:hypothetical protein
LVLRLNQETRASSLHVTGADHTRRHPTSRPSGHWVPDLCDHPRSSAPGLLLLSRSSSLHAMPHLPSAHHETSKHDYPNETKVKERQNKTVQDSNSNLVKSMTHHNQTKELTTWFLILNRHRQGLQSWRCRLTTYPLPDLPNQLSPLSPCGPARSSFNEVLTTKPKCWVLKNLCPPHGLSTTRPSIIAYIYA